MGNWERGRGGEGERGGSLGIRVEGLGFRV